MTGECITYSLQQGKVAINVAMRWPGGDSMSSNYQLLAWRYSRGQG